jgi:hypothetical protein
MRVTELTEKEVALSINTCFSVEGLPKRIKIDNGLPMARPQQIDVPTLTELWWTGLGIEVIRNQPACPQQNGTVEGLQGICARWSEPNECKDIESLQKSVNEANRIQRFVYRVPRKKHQTRASMYPSLESNPRRYKPQDFSMERVWLFLAERVWRRTVYSSGTIRFCGEVFYIGRQFRNVDVTITFDPMKQVWMIRNRKGELLKIEPKVVFEESEILNHVNRSNNKDTT